MKLLNKLWQLCEKAITYRIRNLRSFLFFFLKLTNYEKNSAAECTKLNFVNYLRGIISPEFRTDWIRYYIVFKESRFERLAVDGGFFFFLFFFFENNYTWIFFLLTSPFFVQGQRKIIFLYKLNEKRNWKKYVQFNYWKI